MRACRQRGLGQAGGSTPWPMLASSTRSRNASTVAKTTRQIVRRCTPEPSRCWREARWAAWERLPGTYVENLPWLECAERYDRAHTFHYMDPPYWQTAGYGVDFSFDNYERMADFMRRCKGKVMVSINDHPDIRRVFEGFHFETTEIRYTTTNQRQGKAEVTGELIIMNWEPEALGGLF